MQSHEQIISDVKAEECAFKTKICSLCQIWLIVPKILPSFYYCKLWNEMA